MSPTELVLLFLVTKPLFLLCAMLLVWIRHRYPASHDAPRLASASARASLPSPSATYER